MDGQEKRGKVWLAGAGPGDAALLTVKTKGLLEEADVIVYDALVSAEILSLIPLKKELIYVGKRLGHHSVPQPEINRILVREALKGKQVLRLKGGDPFVFGRGGEELESLLEAGISCEIVPGVTSAAAVPAYAGIPVTHREYASSFHVITGHAKAGKETDIAYDALVKLKGTLVFLMGITAMPSICRGLLEAGMPADTPAAVLERGTLAGQRSVVSVLERITREAQAAKIKPPAILLVGKVCALAERFAWADRRILGGRQFVTTRPKQNSSRLAEELRRLGAQVIELPAVETEPVIPNPALEEALACFKTRAGEKWLVWTSPIGVQVFFDSLRKMRVEERTLLGCPGLRTAAIGSGTARALEAYGLFADVVPKVYCAKALGEEIAKRAAKGAAVTVVRAAKGSEELLPPLLEAGLRVEDIPLYETRDCLNAPLREKIKETFANGEIDAVTFTSASTVEGFVRMTEGVELSDIQAVCIGEQTAAAAEKYGMQILISREASIDSLVETVKEQFGHAAYEEEN